ncbi:protein translocase subunit SecE [Planctomycetales bacterium]|nr:protein translocase subunit SecE [Planctomycetales bacterium]
MNALKSLFAELFSIRRYKANQGKAVRYATFYGAWIFFISGAWVFWNQAFAEVPVLNEMSVRGVIAGLIAVFGGWFSYRLIQWAVFADFLISVESEMVKVSWPSKNELYQSTLVVLAMFVIIAAFIFVFDLVWLQIFKWIKIMS